jgi:hypothetical protein
MINMYAVTIAPSKAYDYYFGKLEEVELAVNFKYTAHLPINFEYTAH